jgi:Na+/proline symporter
MVLFGILVVELKGNAPSSHTFPEINARFGGSAHKVFLFFALMTNTIVTAMLLVLGGVAVIQSLSGVNIYVAPFLIPIGVIVYTFF